MLAWAALVGASFPLIGLVSPELPPLSLTTLRFGIAAVVLLPLVWRAPGRWPSGRGLGLYGLLGLCLACLFGTMFWAAPRATALSMASLYVTVPALSYGLGRRLGVERRGGGLLLVLLLGAAGALALGWAGQRGGGGGRALGAAEAVFFLGCVGSALYPVLSKWGLGRGWLSPRAELRTFWSLLAGAVAVGLAALVGEEPRRLASMAGSDLLLVTFLGVFSTGVTFSLAQRAVAVLTPASVTAYSYLVPFASMLALFVREPHRIGWRWLPGAVLVVVAIALLLARGVSARPRLAPSAGR